MELTRRDALAVLAGTGIVGGGAAAVGRRELDDYDAPDRDHVVETLVAAARVVYPSEVSGVREFVETATGGRLDARPDHAAGAGRAVATLDDTATTWYGDRFAALDADTRDAVLRELGAHTASENPEGTDAERVRYYVVNEVLYVLFSSPAGGRLVGIENPQGHPGGTKSYQRGP